MRNLGDIPIDHFRHLGSNFTGTRKGLRRVLFPGENEKRCYKGNRTSENTSV